MSDSEAHITTREEVILDPVTKREAMRVRIEEIRDQNSPQRLALQLAEAMHRVGEAQNDAIAFGEFASSETMKASELRDLMHRIKTEGRENVRTFNPKTGKPRRMDPLQEYDLGALQTEIDLRRRRAQEFREKANEAKSIVSDSRREADMLQRKLRKLREAG